MISPGRQTGLQGGMKRQTSGSRAVEAETTLPGRTVTTIAMPATPLYIGSIPD